MTISAEQLVLPLPVRTALGRSDFFVAPCNALALRQLDDWQNWSSGTLALIGPLAAGKTHLAHVWASETGAKIVDAAQLSAHEVEDYPSVVVEGGDSISGNKTAQEQLFHLYNIMAADNRPLLITGQLPPARWAIELPDLVSRLSTIPVARLDQPDDVLLGMIMVKLFGDRQVLVGPELIAYLLKHMDRAYRDAVDLVEKLDKAAFSRKRPLTVHLARQILAL